MLLETELREAGRECFKKHSQWKGVLLETQLREGSAFRNTVKGRECF